jgi:hypothetical protein
MLKFVSLNDNLTEKHTQTRWKFVFDVSAVSPAIINVEPAVSKVK